MYSAFLFCRVPLGILVCRVRRMWSWSCLSPSRCKDHYLTLAVFSLVLLCPLMVPTFLWILLEGVTLFCAGAAWDLLRYKLLSFPSHPVSQTSIRIPLPLLQVLLLESWWQMLSLSLQIPYSSFWGLSAVCGVVVVSCFLVHWRSALPSSAFRTLFWPVFWVTTFLLPVEFLV